MSANLLAKTISYEPEEDIFYPETDGEPMAESDFQRNPLIYCVEALKERFSKESDVYVSGNLLIYYEKGKRSKSVAPDVFVVFGVSGHDRSSYKIWEEGKSPDVAIEIISKTTWKKDLDNVGLYQRLGVGEYFLFDPLDRYLDPPLRGYRLDAKGRYRWTHTRRLSDGTLRTRSSLLGLELRVESGKLRLYDPKRREYLFDYAEERQGRLQEKKRAEQAEDRAEQAEDRAEQAEDRAEQEKERADQAEEEIRQLKEKLRALGH